MFEIDFGGILKAMEVPWELMLNNSAQRTTIEAAKLPEKKFVPAKVIPVSLMKAGVKEWLAGRTFAMETTVIGESARWAA